MTPIMIQQALDLAMQHHQAGRLQEAEALYRRILAEHPNHADTLHMLGVLAGQVGRNDAAVDLIGKAIAADPAKADYHGNLGVFLRNQDKLDEAVASYQRALQINPAYAEAHYNLGNIYLKREQFDQAIACYERAIQFKPDYAAAHNNLGNARFKNGQLNQAAVSYLRATQIKPDYAEAHSNLGNVWKETGQLDQAIDWYRRALRIKPDYADAYSNLGAVWTEKGHLEEGIACCQRGVALKPNHAEAYNNLGMAWDDKGQLEQAVACFQRAMEIKPDYADAHNNAGETWKDRGQLDEAMACYRKALELNPRLVSAGDNLLLAMHYHPAFDSQDIFAQSQHWDRQHAEPLRQLIQPHSNQRDPDRRLRIGYVSPDFRKHSVAYFLESLLANHDSAQVEVFCYANVRRLDQTTERFKAHAHHWQNIVGQSDAQVAEQIRRDGIDILVDLAGHTGGNRLLVFARKPAPVQITYLGYPDITGLETIDYRLTDALADPPNGEQSRCEELFRLPRCFLCYCPPPAPPPASTQGGLTFGSFNAHPKINPQLIEVWSQLLRQLPHSRLLLKNRSLADSSTRDRLLKSFAQWNIAPDRLELRAKTDSLAEHLATYHQIDIALDTFPYNGTTTTCEALWMGVPVIALAGQCHMSRVGVSILTNAGLSELIASTSDEYIKLATNLAANPSHLQTLHTTLRDRVAQSPLMDAAGFARDIEAAYRIMWHKWRAKQKP